MIDECELYVSFNLSYRGADSELKSFFNINTPLDLKKQNQCSSSHIDCATSFEQLARKFVYESFLLFFCLDLIELGRILYIHHFKTAWNCKKWWEGRVAKNACCSRSKDFRILKNGLFLVFLALLKGTRLVYHPMCVLDMRNKFEWSDFTFKWLNSRLNVRGNDTKTAIYWLPCSYLAVVISER